jgi:hypothetical protein
LFDDNVQELRILYTSAVLASGTSLPIVITGDGKRVFHQSSDQQ